MYISAYFLLFNLSVSKKKKKKKNNISNKTNRKKEKFEQGVFFFFLLSLFLSLPRITGMPPFRNPFVKRTATAAAASPSSGANLIGDENARPVGANGIDKESTSLRPEYAGSRASSALSIKSRQEEPREYKLSGR